MRMRNASMGKAFSGSKSSTWRTGLRSTTTRIKLDAAAGVLCELARIHQQGHVHGVVGKGRARDAHGLAKTPSGRRP